MIIGIVSIFYFYFFRKFKFFFQIIQIKKIKPFNLFTVAIFTLFSVWFLIQNISEGSLENRYFGETVSTLAGNKNKTINVITTGRSDMFLEDLKIWRENFLFGVGAGASNFKVRWE